jgi:hypothetical protein
MRTSLHRPNGTTVCITENRRLDKLNDIYKSTDTNPPFAEPLAKLIHRKNKKLREPHLSNARSIIDTQTLLCGGWSILNKLYDTLDAYFQIDRVLLCKPYNLPIRANTYYSKGLFNFIFSAQLPTNTSWTCTAISLSEFQSEKLTTALQKAIYNAHLHKETNHSSTIRILPD